MKKNKSKRILLAAFIGLFLLEPVQHAYLTETAEAAQVSASHDSKLSAFDIAPGDLSPAFSPDITEYTSTVNADVTSVSVQAVPRASGAVIASVEGRDGLHPGVNTIKVTCSAQDNTYTVYTITLTVGSAGAQQPETDSMGNDQPDNGADNAQSDGQTGDDSADNARSDGQTGDNSADNAQSDGQTGDNSADNAQSDGQTGGTSAGADAQSDAGQTKKRSLAQRLSGTVKADGTVKLSGAAYQLSSNFTYGATSQDIPSAFGQGSVQIGENNYQTLYCEANGIHLVYMENTDGKGTTGFYYYDEKKNAVERFKYTGIGDNFVVYISNAREEVPAGYQEKALKFPSGKKVAAYQSQFSDELKDYYLVYGIYSDGSSGWYLYDKSQGTYLRYSNAFAAAQGLDDEDGEEEVERTVSLTKYNTLNEKYTELKDSRVKIVSILVIVIVLMIILFTALLLRGHEEEEEKRSSKKKKSRKAGKQTETISKSSLAAGRNFEGNVSKKAKKVTKTFTQEPAVNLQEQPSAYRDNISTPEQIRAQVSRERENRAKMDSGRKSEEQRAYGRQKEPSVYGQIQKEPSAYGQVQKEQPVYGQAQKEQPAYGQVQKEPSAYGQVQKEQPVYGQVQKERPAYGQMQNGGRMHQSGSSTDTVQMAAERMRESVQYSRRYPKAEPAEPEHDPMDDWDMEETVSRRPQKAGKASRKRRGYKDEDMEIMDLNDL